MQRLPFKKLVGRADNILIEFSAIDRYTDNKYVHIKRMSVKEFDKLWEELKLKIMQEMGGIQK